MTPNPDETFDVAIIREAGSARIRITGELDWETVDELAEAVRVCLRAHPAPRSLHLDCARLIMCDSMGLAALLMARRDTAAVGTQLYVDNQPPVLQRLLELTGTAHILPGTTIGKGGPDARERHASDSSPLAPPQR